MITLDGYKIVELSAQTAILETAGGVRQSYHRKGDQPSREVVWDLLRDNVRRGRANAARLPKARLRLEGGPVGDGGAAFEGGNEPVNQSGIMQDTKTRLVSQSLLTWPITP